MGVLRALATIRVLLNNVLLFKFFPIFLQQNIFLCFEYDRNTDRHFATYGAALTADNPHLYLSIVTHFRSLRAGGFKFGPSLNKFGVGVSIGKQRSTISCFVEVLYNLSLFTLILQKNRLHPLFHSSHVWSDYTEEVWSQSLHLKTSVL